MFGEMQKVIPRNSLGSSGGTLDEIECNRWKNSRGIPGGTLKEFPGGSSEEVPKNCWLKSEGIAGGNLEDFFEGLKTILEELWRHEEL